MPVKLTCKQCGGGFTAPPSIAKRRKFCSVDCANEAQTTAEQREITCESCGESFRAKKDHGRWPRFCSRECFHADSVFAGLETKIVNGEKKILRNCDHCGAEFWAGRSGHGRVKTCSKECKHESMRVGDLKTCPACGKRHHVSPSKARKGIECCSVECRREYRKIQNSGAWKGGAYVKEDSGEEFIVRNLEEGRIKTYLAKRRAIASIVIGRMLTSQEIVIRINADESNDDPSNLYICRDRAEYCEYRYRSGWPTKSNLNSYR